MKKISYKELCDSMSMFFVYDDICKNLESQIHNRCAELQQYNLHDINTKHGLMKFIKDHEDSLESLLLLLDISEEYFKRIISLFRIEEDLVFQTEWSLSATRNYLLTHQSFMDKICNLFLKANDDPELCKKIPYYNLQSFKITNEVIERLSNKDFLYRIAKKDFDSAYTAEVKQRNLNRVEEIIEKNLDKTQFEVERMYTLKITNQFKSVLNYVIKRKGTEMPVCLIKTGFITTTSKAQTSFQKEVGTLAAYIRDNNLRNETKLITIVDGAGWIARKSALQPIHDYSTYCINFNHLDDLGQILTEL